MSSVSSNRLPSKYLQELRRGKVERIIVINDGILVTIQFQRTRYYFGSDQSYENGRIKSFRGQSLWKILYERAEKYGFNSYWMRLLNENKSLVDSLEGQSFDIDLN